MKKKIHLLGAAALGTFLLSVVFKILHWMGAPTLLGLSTLLFSAYIVGLIVARIKK